jgi:hypothetical protein
MKEDILMCESSLYVNCFDVVTVSDRVTFNSFLLHGLDVAFWLENGRPESEILDELFNVLFTEVDQLRIKRGVSAVNL